MSDFIHSDLFNLIMLITTVTPAFLFLLFILGTVFSGMSNDHNKNKTEKCKQEHNLSDLLSNHGKLR